jgi:hypothetical protein
MAQRQADAGASLTRAEESLQRAPQDDARSLASWLADGERGERPTASVYERERERDAARLLLDAVAVEFDAALSERLAYVEKHRERMLEDAQRDVTEAREALLKHVHGLHELRDILLAARETLAWAASYPDPAEGFGFPNALALGLRGPVEKTLHTTARVEYGSILAALEEDAQALADAHTDAGEEAPRNRRPAHALPGSDVGFRRGHADVQAGGARAGTPPSRVGQRKPDRPRSLRL